MQNFQTVHTYCFNPKSISMGELYGNYNLMTNEWTDGLGRRARPRPPTPRPAPRVQIHGHRRGARTRFPCPCRPLP